MVKYWGPITILAALGAMLCLARLEWHDDSWTNLALMMGAFWCLIILAVLPAYSVLCKADDDARVLRWEIEELRRVLREELAQKEHTHAGEDIVTGRINYSRIRSNGW